NVGASVFPKEGFLPSIDSAAQSAQRAVKEQEEFIGQLKEQQATQTEIEKRRKSTEESAKKEAEDQKKIAESAKAAAEAMAKADAMRRDNDRAVVKLDLGKTDRAKALSENQSAFDELVGSKEMEGLKKDSPEYLRLVAEFRRKEAAINQDFDQRGVESERA